MSIIDSPSLATVIREAISSRLIDVHTAMPGRVENYNETDQTADIQPQAKRVIRRADGERIAETLPVIPCVPVQWPRGGGFFVSLPLAIGDFGMLIFNEYSIDRWRSQGEQVDPADERRHGLSGAVFVPGVHPAAKPIGDASATRLVIGKDGGTGIDMDAAAIRLGKAAATEGIGLGDVIQTFIDVFFAWIPVATDGGAKLKADLVAAFPGGSPTVASKHKVEP